MEELSLSSVKLEQNLEETCAHPTVLQGMCVICSQVMDDGYGVAFDYIQKGLRLSKDEISRLKNTNSEKLFGEKKLQLVLDIDHTLVHMKNAEELTSEEKYLENQIDSFPDLFKLKTGYNSGYMVKLRPFIRTFLQEVSNMFELYIYTMGNRIYADKITQLLDPEGKYFSGRVISQHDVNQSRNRKSLDLVLGMECGIIILDDLESAWSECYKNNVIQMKRYSYFAEKRNHNRSYSASKEDESESNGALAYTLTVLKAIHGLFFSTETSSLPSKDVTVLLETLRSKVLMGCIIFFSDADKHYTKISSRATMMGAVATNILDSSVTHVVSRKKDEEASLWAQQKNKFLVHPRWLNNSYYLWHRQPEEKFPVLK